MDMAAVVHIKSDYKSWEDLMPDHADNQKEVDEGKVLYGKVNDKMALVLRFDFDPEEMRGRVSNPEFQKMTSDAVERHEFYAITPMKQGCR